MGRNKPSPSTEKMDTVYNLPNVESFPDESPSTEIWLSRLRLIEVTTSTAWGPPDVAATRALLETDVTQENVELIRTYHPAFAHAGTYLVTIMTERDGRRIWVIFDSRRSSTHLYAGGLEVHNNPDPQHMFYEEQPIRPWQPDRLDRAVNPRRLLSPNDLDDFRIMFPHSCGVRLWIGGAIQMVYPSKDHLRASLAIGVPPQLNGFQIYWDVLDAKPSTTAAPYGDDLAQGPSVGLRLRCLDGQQYLTTVTHELVRLPLAGGSNIATGVANRIVDVLFWVKDVIFKSKTLDHPASKRGYTSAEELPTSNHPLGKEIRVSGGRSIGTITETFDTPCHLRPFPFGYAHDLSLIKIDDHSDQVSLPCRVQPPGVPVIDGWASVSDALEGKPLFVTVPSTHHQRAVTKALAEGTQYLWDSENLEQSVSLMWKVEDVAGVLQASSRLGAAGACHFSGSILCVGSADDKTAEALLFQNFELPWPTPPGTVDPAQKERKKPTVAYGFLLPTSIIRHCSIEHGRDDEAGGTGSE